MRKKWRMAQCMIFGTSFVLASSPLRAEKSATTMWQTNPKNATDHWLVTHDTSHEILSKVQKSRKADVIQIQTTTTWIEPGSEKETVYKRRFSRQSVTSEGTKDLWQVEDSGDNFRIEKNVGILSTTLTGCCGASDSTRIFSLSNGSLLMPFSLPNSSLPPTFEFAGETYFIGYHDRYWPGRDTKYVAREDTEKRMIFGILTLTSTSGIIHQLAVTRDRWTDPTAEPVTMEMIGDAGKVYLRAIAYNDRRAKEKQVLKATVDDLTLPSGMKKASLTLTWLDPTVKIVIPFNNDGFDLKEAKMPKEFQLEEIKAEERRSVSSLQ